MRPIAPPSAPAYVCKADLERLGPLAAGATPDAVALRRKIQRAIVIGQGDAPQGFARLGSIVEYVDLLSGLTHWVRLVLPGLERGPGRADLASPLGLALLGALPGTAVGCRLADGKPRVLQVVRVEQPSVPAPAARPGERLERAKSAAAAAS
jgi:transcription elongation GreA/GreB family factor